LSDEPRQAERLEPDLELVEDTRDMSAEDAQLAAQVSGMQAMLGDRRRLLTGILLFLLLVVAIYVLAPKLLGLDEAMERLDEGLWYWIVLAVVLNFGAFAAYVALFRGVLGGSRDDEVRRRLDVSASYQITMAGLAATRIFSAAGAGGIAVTYWALRRAGMPRRRSACRMVAFLVLMYTPYLMALLIFGVLLRTGVLSGSAPFGGTVVPAVVAGGLTAILLLIALIPRDFERRLDSFARGYRRARFVRRLAAAPATLSTGVRTAFDYVQHPKRGSLAVGGAIGFWAANIAVLWASFEAFGGHVAFGVLVQGFFVGMAANLIPSPAGGVGSVDAGMIAAFALFDIPTEVVFPAVLCYRVIAFWLPIPPGIVAYFQLRKTADGWEREQEDGVPAGLYTSKSKVTAAEVR
jgi:uncharacterized protein (TIRG00374 family)